jgi:hypothetical protein
LVETGIDPEILGRRGLQGKLMLPFLFASLLMINKITAVLLIVVVLLVYSND